MVEVLAPEIDYVLREDGVHHFTFHESNRACCDAFIIKYRQLLVVQNPENPIKLLFDLRPGGIPPITYLFARVRALFAEIGPENMPEVHAAYLHSESPLITIAQTFLDMLRIRAKRRFFLGDKMPQAVGWLHSLQPGIQLSR